MQVCDIKVGLVVSYIQSKKPAPHLPICSLFYTEEEEEEEEEEEDMQNIYSTLTSVTSQCENPREH